METYQWIAVILQVSIGFLPCLIIMNLDKIIAWISRLMRSGR